MVCFLKDGITQRMYLENGRLKMHDGSSVEEYLKQQGFKDGEAVCVIRPACLQKLVDSQHIPLGA